MTPFSRTFTATLALGLFGPGAYYLSSRNRIAAHETVSRMLRIGVIIQATTPSETQPLDLARLAWEGGCEGCEVDGWGRLMIVELAPGKGQPGYQVRSLGRVGKRSDCCAGRKPGAWDLDAVLQGDVWVQTW